MAEEADPRIVQILFTTKDPTVKLDTHPVPAMTTLLHRICRNRPDDFEEATRLVELFIAKALETRTEDAFRAGFKASLQMIGARWENDAILLKHEDKAWEEFK